MKRSFQVEVFVKCPADDADAQPHGIVGGDLKVVFNFFHHLPPFFLVLHMLEGQRVLQAKSYFLTDLPVGVAF